MTERPAVPHHTYTTPHHTSTTTTASEDVVVVLEELSRRGIVDPSQLLSFASPATILETCAWFDEQRGVGPGLLAKTIRDGGAKHKPRRSMLEEQAEYGEQIVEWLRKNFPQWNRDEGNRTHSAAIAAVIRLHHKHGRGRITKAEHGSVIRGAVRDWDAKWGGAINKEDAA